MKYFYNNPWWLRMWWPHYLWRKPTTGNEVYLTFDDGPHPDITPWVLEQLEYYDFKATFFLIGDRLERYPELARQIRAAGHVLGNHTYNHLNGWKTNKGEYLDNFRKAERLLSTQLFRPPYGKIRNSQGREIRKSHQVVMWDIISGDFDQRLSSEQCVRNVIKYVRPGSIIVFHDSEKAFPRLEKALPEILLYLREAGLQSKAL